MSRSADQPGVELHNFDCRDAMDLWVPTESIDSIVTDPPYGLSFMGKAWDHGVPGVEFWQSALRVLKPGGYCLAFGGTRTFHRLACAIEDAGFEVRDTVMWVYGSGFPKSHNGPWGGTALKPAWEPILMARKPLTGTTEANWRTYGTGALNIEGCRVATDDNLNGGAYAKNATSRDELWGDDAGNSWVRGGAGEFTQPVGRWPANLIHDGSDEVIAAFPEAQGQQGKTARRTQGTCYSNVDEGCVGTEPRGDTGSAARFFYCAKASRTDRGADNRHPTVKPTDLMRYLCRLVTPAGGLVLDPFMGSGSTGKAAVLEGFRFIGVEVDSDYVDIARNRIAQAAAESGPAK